MEIISPRRKETLAQYFLEFAYSNTNEAGFSFPSDEHGELLPGQDESLLKNYEKCKNGYPDIVPLGVKKFTNAWTEPAVGRCYCGKEVQLIDVFGGACQCECEQWYSINGQSLVPPEQWEEPIEVDY